MPDKCMLVGTIIVPFLMSSTQASAAPRGIEYFCFEQLQNATLPHWRGAGEAFMANCIADLTPPTPTKKSKYRKR
jgi:hypothetical protein